MSERNANIATIFDHAVEIASPEQRREYLDQACGGDGALRARVEALLRASNDAGSFLEKPPAGLAATIATGEFHTVDDGLGEVSLDFLAPSPKPNCLGTLGQYEVIDVIGRGGMGLVLRAYDTKLNRVVAIKAMAPELAASPMAVKRFLREARAAASISHDHVITIHAVHEGSRPPFIVMECVDGQSLQQKIDRQGALDVQEIMRIGRQTAAGLAAAHQQGLVHRDIKPANILLENGVERVKLTDFGLARAVDDVSVTQTGQIAGSPQFMSPEQAQGYAVDARSDLFSLGSVLYAMCTGRPPFRGDTAVAMLRRVTDDNPRRIRELNPEIPDWLEAIVFKLLAKNPAERFQSAEEVADLLSRHLAHLQHPTAVAQPPRVRAPASPSVESLQRELNSTANFLWAAGILSLVIGLLAVLSLLGLTIGSGNAPAWLIISGFVSLPIGLTILVGAHHAEKRKSYGWALAATLLCLLPVNPFLVFMLPVTIWTLVWLGRPGVQELFLPEEKAPPKPSLRRVSWTPLVLVAALAAAACLALFLVAVGLYFVRTSYGTIRVEANDPSTTVTIDDEMGVSLQNAKDNAVTLSVRVGEHRLHIRQGDLQLETDTFRVRRAEDVVVRVEMIDGKLAARLIRPHTRPAPGGSVTTYAERVIGLQRESAGAESAAIRTSNGNYWRFGGENQAIMTDATTIGENETFTLEWQDTDRTVTYIRTAQDLYLRGVVDRQGELVAARERGSSELFQVEWIDRAERTFRLRTRDGVYVGTDGDGLRTIAVRPDSAEPFTLVPRQTAVLYLISTDGQLVRVQVGPGGFEETVLHSLGNMWRDVEGLAMADDGLLYAAVHGPNDASSLYKIDVVSGSAVQVAPMQLSEVDGLAWRNGQLYAVTSRYGGHHARLLEVDPKTGRTQPIGDTMSLGDLDSLAFDPRGRLLTTDGVGVDDKIYALDRDGVLPPQPLAATPPIIESSCDIEGLALAADGQLYGLTHPDPFGRGPHRSYLVRIDPETFEYENLGLLSYGALCLAAEPRTAEAADRITQLGRLLGHTDHVRDVALSPDGNSLFTGGGERRLFLWNLAAGKVIRKYPTDSPIVEIVPHPDGKHVLSSQFEGGIKLRDLASGGVVRSFETSRKPDGLAVSPDGRRLLSGGQDGLVTLWDVETGEVIHRFEEQYSGAVAMSSDGQLAAHASNWGMLRVWNVETGETLHHIQRQAGSIGAIAFSPDSRYLASGDYHGIVQLWDVASGAQLHYLDAHTAEVGSLLFTPDGGHCISGSFDKSILIHETATGHLVAQHECDTSVAANLALTPDGRMLISAGGFDIGRRGQEYFLRKDGDYAIRLWRLPPHVWPRAVQTSPASGNG